MHYDRRRTLQLGLAAASLSVTAPSAFAIPRSWSGAISQPAANAKPWIRWWWPGGVVEDKELRREIGLLKKAGFGGAEIQAFNPAIPNLTADERKTLQDYANPAFFSHIAEVADEATKQGLQIDYTLGSAWPSGGGFAVTPELALVELTPAITSIVAPVQGPIKITLPSQTRKFGAMGSLDSRNKDPRVADWKDRLAKRWRLVAIIAVQGDAPVLKPAKSYRETDVITPGVIAPGAGIVVTDKLQADGTLDWTPPSPGPWQIIAFKQFNVDSGILAGVGEGPQLILDHFNKAAFEAHAKRVGDPLDRLGSHKKALRATFIDSLELMADLYWCDDFLAQFQKRRGYDLTPYLPYILQPGWEAPWNPRYSQPYYVSGDTGDRVRADYRLTVSELLDENFWQPFVEWNHAHGFKARLQAHGGPSDWLKSYGLADIPETEDLGSGGDTHFMRLARAAADIYGRKIVSCESLCWIGKPYEITPAQWLARANLLFVSGVNELVMHGFPYALHADAWPGWFPFAPSPFLSGFSSQINEANPLWAGIPTLNTYIQRAQTLLQRGSNTVPVAVLLTDIGYGDNFGDKDVEVWLQALLDAGYDYDRINPDGLATGRAVNGALVTPGGVCFETIIVPPLEGIRPETIGHLLELARAGIKVIFVDKVPARSETLNNKAAGDAAVCQAVASILNSGARVSPEAALVAALSDLGVPPNVTFLGKPLLFIEKRLGNETLFVFHNTSDQATDLACKVRAKGRPARLDLFSGKQTGIEAKRQGAETEIRLRIEAGAAAFVLFTADAPNVTSSKTTIRDFSITNPWRLSVSGHGHKGRFVTQTIDAITLSDLSGIDGLTDFSGAATYTTCVTIDPTWLGIKHEVWLDLGMVHDMAKITINGVEATTLIAAPFQVDISKHVKAGANIIEVAVFNNPNNAMMDPKLPGLKDLKQKPAGLVGPARLCVKV